MCFGIVQLGKNSIALHIFLFAIHKRKSKYYVIMILYMWLAYIHANQENPNQLQVTLLLELVVTNVYILLKREGYF